MKIKLFKNVVTYIYLLLQSDDKGRGYVSRNTAIGLCDPWVDLQMDREILPRLIPPKGQGKDKGKE